MRVFIFLLRLTLVIRAYLGRESSSLKVFFFLTLQRKGTILLADLALFVVELILVFCPVFSGACCKLCFCTC